MGCAREYRYIIHQLLIDCGVINAASLGANDYSVVLICYNQPLDPRCSPYARHLVCSRSLVRVGAHCRQFVHTYPKAKTRIRIIKYKTK